MTIINNVPQPINIAFIETFDLGWMIFVVCWGRTGGGGVGVGENGYHGICCGIGVFVCGTWSTIGMKFIK